MPEPAAARPLTTMLAVAYPIAAHIAVARQGTMLTVGAVALLALAVLSRPLVQGQFLRRLPAAMPRLPGSR